MFARSALKQAAGPLATWLILTSCVTQPPEEPPPPLTAAGYLERGRELLAGVTEDRFFGWLNQESDSFPQETRMLLSEFVAVQRRLRAHWTAQGDYFRARAAFDNTRAARAIDAEAEAAFYRELIDGFRAAGHANTSRYLQILLGERPTEMATTLPSVAEYRRLLVEIQVGRSYEGPQGVVRRDFPGSYGSGILIGPEHVLTAYHVIEHVFDDDTKDTNISVRLGERVVENVEVHSTDSLSDLAVLLLPEPMKMPYPIEQLLGDSTALEQGDAILGLGHSRGLAATLTSGIVSAVERQAPEVGSWLQIDADVSPGASGGLILGADSHIYGVIVAGYIGEGLNFAVPSAAVLSVLDRMLAGEEIRRPWLGVLLDQNWPQERQAHIADLFPTSPVSDSGIAVGDSLLQINHRSIDRVSRAQELLYNLSAGTWVHLRVAKPDGSELDRWVRLARRPDYAIYNATREGNQLSSLYPHFGFAVHTDELRSTRLGVSGRFRHLTFYEVARISDDSFLASRGVEPGDLVGFIDDYFEDKTRFIELLHLPQGKSVEDLGDDLGEFVFFMSKGHTDGNIL